MNPTPFLGRTLRRTLQVSTVVLLAALTACGGGGDAATTGAGGTGTPPPGTGTPPPPPVSASFTLALSTPKALILQGTSVAVDVVATRSTGFDAAGKAVSGVGPTDDYAQAMALQPDGKIIVAGWGNGPLGYAFELVRFQRDGAIDASFGTAGTVISAIGQGANQANAIALQADGKILVAGSVDKTPNGKSFALARYHGDGSLDTSFGTGGSVITSFGSASDEAFAIAVQPDGKIVLGGHTRSATTGLDFAFARYNADGSADAGFGSNGQVVLPIRAGNSRDSVYALALQTVAGELRIVAVGGEGDFVVARLQANGAPDASFGGGAAIDSAFGTVIGAARAVAITADNRIVVAGHANHAFALLQLNADGLADNAFGGNGRVVTPVSATNWDEAQAVAVQADGRIVVGGWVYAGNGSSGDHVVARYNTDGTLDAGFGNAGMTITAVAPGTKADEGRALLLQVDDRLPAVRSVLAGSANDANQDFVVTRYWH